MAICICDGRADFLYSESIRVRNGKRRMVTGTLISELLSD